jgi:glycosyltransferase involved in cell wall biosynthesis
MTVKLIYVANIRLPTEKAHGLQIMQNCEAFADNGAQVSLWTANRANTPEMRAVKDVWEYYGVQRSFKVRRLPCIDLLPLVPERTDRTARLIFYLQLATFTLSALLLALFTRADVYYSRDPLVIIALSFIKPRRKLAYEAHTLRPSEDGQRLQRQAVTRAGTVIAITSKLREELVKLGADPARSMVAHDGIQKARFARMPSQADARRELGWPEDALIVGYVGRLHTLTMDKGVGALVKALGQVDGAALAVVGGPDDMAAVLREQWLEAGLDAAAFLYAGHVPPGRVPLYLSAFDICAMPHPWTEQFAYYTSPIKLFEYMASGRPIVASDLPGFAEVVTDGESALLVKPGDIDGLAGAINLLAETPVLRERLAYKAKALVLSGYTWEARARHILEFITGQNQD